MSEYRVWFIPDLDKRDTNGSALTFYKNVDSPAQGKVMLDAITLHEISRTEEAIKRVWGDIREWPWHVSVWACLTLFVTFKIQHGIDFSGSLPNAGGLQWRESERDEWDEWEGEDGDDIDEYYVIDGELVLKDDTEE